MEENNSSDFTLYILLSVSGILMVIDGLELMHLIFNWQYAFMVIAPIFQRCIKYELISKTIFAFYSFVAATSAFSLTFFLLNAQTFFLEKFLKTFLYINYITFGPLMLAFSILGIYHWDEVVYICDKNNLNNKELSISNSVSIIGCFLISFMLTVIVEFFESFNFLLDSILKRNSGSHTIGKFFWYIVLSRANRIRMRSVPTNDNQQNSNNNINNNLNSNNNGDNRNVNNHSNYNPIVNENINLQIENRLDGNNLNLQLDNLNNENNLNFRNTNNGDIALNVNNTNYENFNQNLNKETSNINEKDLVK